MTQITPDRLAGYFDHTLLKAQATKEGLTALCDEAKRYGFAMVAINPYPVRLCKELLAGTPIHVGAAVAFPLGQTTIAEKVSETRNAIADGADEIDYVVNITELKAGNTAYLTDEMSQIVAACREHGVLSKVIFENCYLTEDEKKALCGVANEVGPDFVKTSTGFGTGGATFADVELMRSLVDERIRVKAAGGIRSLDDALRYIDLGVSRIGASSSVSIVEDLRSRA